MRWDFIPSRSIGTGGSLSIPVVLRASVKRISWNEWLLLLMIISAVLRSDGQKNKPFYSKRPQKGLQVGDQTSVLTSARTEISLCCLIQFGRGAVPPIGIKAKIDVAVCGILTMQLIGHLVFDVRGGSLEHTFIFCTLLYCKSICWGALVLYRTLTA